MPGDPRRADRVAEGIREEVATFLAEGARDPRIVGFVTVTGVELTRDLRHARVFVSIMGSEEDRQSTLEGLGAVAPALRGIVGRALRLRLAPEIAFHLDESAARAARIASLLAQVKQESRADDDAGGT
ncbi:MAG: ribosome-binding factor A [Gemmatimonadaceae bacterium]